MKTFLANLFFSKNVSIIALIIFLSISQSVFAEQDKVKPVHSEEVELDSEITSETESETAPETEQENDLESEQTPQEHAQEEQTPKIESLPLDELAALADAYAEIKKSYVLELSDKEILDAAVRGMLNNLDPYSTFLSAEELAKVNESATGDYAGIGILASHLPEGIEVTQVFLNSPAQKSGLAIGDLITHINGESTENMSEMLGSKKMRGQAGTKLTVQFIDAQTKKNQSVIITREIIHLTSVRFQLLEKNIGFARIEEFQVRSTQDLVQAINKMEKQNKGPLKGFILDLRNNPGGLLDGATEIADLFLNDGVIVSTKGRQKKDEEIHYATSGDLLRGQPMVILINNNSASASEIVAGALQDHKRAYIIGLQSYGKAMVQTVLPIHGGSAIKLTTSLYYTPNDRLIQDKGINPDQELPFIPQSETADSQQVSFNLEQANASQPNDFNYKLDNQVSAAVEWLQTSLTQPSKVVVKH